MFTKKLEICTLCFALFVFVFYVIPLSMDREEARLQAVAEYNQEHYGVGNGY